MGPVGRSWLAVCIGLCSILTGATAWAHDPDIPEVTVPEISVLADRPVAASSQQFIPDKEYVLQPQGRPAQVLRLIPGLITVEHSGGAGKADQYFLRGFDADHGTDVAFFTDGMPINFRSHAHGQGYADLNFIIPETIEGLDAYKGAYHVELGDFATAGAVNFKTRQVVREGLVQAAGGQFDTQRYLLMLSPTKDKVRTLFAAEGYYTNGPFLNDNRYFRANLLGKVTLNPTSRSELSITGTFQKSQMECLRRDSIAGGTGWITRPIWGDRSVRRRKHHSIDRPLELPLRYPVRRPILRKRLWAVLQVRSVHQLHLLSQ